MECHQYADDIQFYLSLLSYSREAEEVLDGCLEAAGVWIRASNFSEKTEVLLGKNSSMQVPSHQLTLNEVTLFLQNWVHSL